MTEISQLTGLLRRRATLLRGFLTIVRRISIAAFSGVLLTLIVIAVVGVLSQYYDVPWYPYVFPIFTSLIVTTFGFVGTVYGLREFWTTVKTASYINKRITSFLGPNSTESAEWLAIQQSANKMRQARTSTLLPLVSFYLEHVTMDGTVGSGTVELLDNSPNSIVASLLGHASSARIAYGSHKQVVDFERVGGGVKQSQRVEPDGEEILCYYALQLEHGYALLRITTDHRYVYDTWHPSYSALERQAQYEQGSSISFVNCDIDSNTIINNLT